MKFIPLEIPPAGTWIRDCELYAFNKYPSLSLEFNKDSNSTKWRIDFDDYIAFRVTSHEFAIHLICLDEMPDSGAFFSISESVWLDELKKVDRPEVMSLCKHFVLFFYDEVVEVVSKSFKFKQLES